MNEREFCIVLGALGYTEKMISQLNPDTNLILEVEQRLLGNSVRLYDIRLDSDAIREGR